MPDYLAEGIMDGHKDLIPHGRHIFIDFVGYESPTENDGKYILDIIRECIKNSSATEVHSHVTQFDGKSSPLGFAAIVVLDESHFSAHCYSELGWLAIDCFTCGDADTNAIVSSFTSKLKDLIPSLEVTQRENIDRFLHR